MSDRDPRIDMAEKLFKAWSSGDVDGPKDLLAPDCVLYDIVGGEHLGWEKIRAFFDEGLETWPDLVLIPDEYWVSDKGIAMTWEMSATVKDDEFGAELKGHKWRSDGMSYLEFENGLLTREADYHDRGAMPTSKEFSPR